MGNIHSEENRSGAPINPRIKYSRKLEKQSNKSVAVDSPVLVDVEHGSIRYRHSNDPLHTRTQKNEREKPFETDAVDSRLTCKDHYFYHPRLANFQTTNNGSKEEGKLHYVMKGPTSSRGKKLFYVYGRGWDVQDGQKMRPSKKAWSDKDYAWSTKRFHSHLYYQLEVIEKAYESNETHKSTNSESEDRETSDNTDEFHPDQKQFLLHLSSDSSVLAVKSKLGAKITKPPTDIHLMAGDRELRDNEKIYNMNHGIPDLDSESSSTLVVKFIQF